MDRTREGGPAAATAPEEVEGVVEHAAPPWKLTQVVRMDGWRFGLPRWGNAKVVVKMEEGTSSAEIHRGGTTARGYRGTSFKTVYYSSSRQSAPAYVTDNTSDDD